MLSKLIATLTGAVLATGIAGSAIAASDYPAKPVTIVVPFSAGGGTDNLVRTFQPALQEALGQPVVVENRPGGGSTIGTAVVANANADGYTILVADTGITVNPALYDNLPYDTLNDLMPVSLLASGPVILVAHPSVKSKTFDDVLKEAKADPGVLTFASGANGSSTHLAIELMKMVTGADVIHVPYKGSGPATTDLVGGHVQYMFNGISASRPHIDSGALIALGVTGDERNPAVPDVPTFEELGYGEVNPMSIWGAWAPAGTDAEIAEKLASAFNEALNNAEVKEKLNALGFFTVGSSPEDYRERVVSEMKKWKEVVETAGIVIE